MEYHAIISLEAGDFSFPANALGLTSGEGPDEMIEPNWEDFVWIFLIIV